ncbi:5-(carboxyamino)imidazole ribonucleotide synthase [Croceicoccus marinus]|jgi:5-(carboxyamino)imidazole ribonucleotide synthase|uniref:N5-carboxyaminoimidazole ribonucleotide synthase n=1 Tax=Croceicoccus marinus TaxID=450378 RepID=A0A7G6VUV7_9SPHN|nr:5-(carboxyamino)imidazole ribonucleotide synthase [Croceicoccus marinus]QNE05522.1 5-(carboxyamino)imidazole ribonucleotide synthase [Croceicoccus marinus]
MTSDSLSFADQTRHAAPIAPGSTIGILGGGQLGRMLAMAAAQLGYCCHIYAPDGDSVAGDVSAGFTCAPYDDTGALAEFAAACDVITYEFENVPVAPLPSLGDTPLRSPARALEIAQDRLAEKRFVEQHGGTPAPFMAVESEAEFTAALERIGTPGILKTRRDGYDGKGQWRIMSPRDAEDLTLSGKQLIYEGFVDFTAEFSVILVRGLDGEIRFWDSAQNDHSSGILSRSVVPAGAAVAAQVPAARELAARVAEALGYVGVLTLEFFATETGPVFNEMAPRVHNSGHWTIEGARTSQFENHIRAICGLPLGLTDTIVPAVRMDNLIGEEANDWMSLLADPANHLHLYGKAEINPGRKMGHVTRLLTDGHG